MKKILASVAVLMIAVAHLTADPMGGKLVTITAGTPVRLAATDGPNTRVNSLFIQAAPGGTGVIYVLNCPLSVAATSCTKTGGSAVWVATLNAASGINPGGSFTFPSTGSATTNQGGTDLRYWLTDGSNTGDTVTVAYDLRN